MEVVMIPVEKIQVIKRARKHPEEKLFELQDSIRTHGLLHPIIIDSSFRLIAGERRLLAHKGLGLLKIACIVSDANNNWAKLEMEFDENVRRLELPWPDMCRLQQRIYNAKVEETGGDWSLRKQQEVSDLHRNTISQRIQMAEALETMPELEDQPTMEDAFRELDKYREVSAKMQLVLKKPPEVSEAPKWADEHYVIGDAINGMYNFLKTQPHSQGKAFHFAEVDPPYGVDLHRRKGRNADDSTMEEYLEWDDFPKLFETTAQLVKECLAPHAFAVFWYGMSRHQEVLEILRRVGWTVPDIPAIWYKGEIGQTASPYTTFGSCYEPFFVARKGQPRLARAGRGNVFNYPSLQVKTHPTEKPIWLMEEILATFLQPGSNVLVPFMGSGVTLRAAYKLGHHGHGWDLSDKHKEGFLQVVQMDLQKALHDANS